MFLGYDIYSFVILKFSFGKKICCEEKNLLFLVKNISGGVGEGGRG